MSEVRPNRTEIRQIFGAHEKYDEVDDEAVAAGVARWTDSDLMAQLRKSFGFEGTASELVRMDAPAAPFEPIRETTRESIRHR